MAEELLPAVAKSVFVPCKKCGEDRYHTVIAHPTSTSAKMKCEVCGSTKTQKFGTTAKKAKAPGEKKTTRTRVNKADEHKAEYAKLLSSADSDAVKYNMKVVFEPNQKVNHPKFGVGVIRTIFPDKIEVVFEDEVRNLVHNRTT